MLGVRPRSGDLSGCRRVPGPALAKATGKSEDEVRDIIAACTKGRFLGVFGEPTVNVLKVNLMLDGAL